MVQVVGHKKLFGLNFIASRATSSTLEEFSSLRKRDMSSPVVEYLRYTIPREKRESFIQDYKAAAGHLMNSPYSKSFELSECKEDATKFLLRIDWTSGDDHLKRFRTSEEFKEFFKHIKPYLDNIDEMRHYNTVLQLQDE